MKQPREITNKVHAALEDGTLSYQQVAEAALIFLSEDDVERMAHNEEFFIHEHYEDWDFDEADDEE
jgi:hypothetical protein